MSSNDTIKRPSVMDDLRARGLVYQSTDDDTSDRPLSRLLDGNPVTFYAGFDPTASSLTVGNLVPVMLLAHIQRAGHRPIALVGGGTGMVGDPSGKTEMRQLLTAEDVENNAHAQKKQLDRYLDLDAEPSDDGERGFMLNNADWLLNLNYVEFLREVGRHFSINRMLAAESVKLRLSDEAGLSFLEFNYSILQAYDFLVLSRRYGCALQVGGSDQWGNIVAGIDLIRRAEGRQAHALTAPLLTTSSGQKMGKTEKGSVWLDPERTSPYDFYQFWINSDDRDVIRYLKIFTFLPVGQIASFEGREGADLRGAKELLALEATRLAHGEEEAKKAQEGSGNTVFWRHHTGPWLSLFAVTAGLALHYR
ncbi:MAG: tyrosine--tRNA ligase, partial [Planctomycetes bacterium]|nr:tyrosine--tRNA ligase [Planctomycetota bacterium]